jgi:endonuclease YncB( thermonuclease family)
MRWRGRFDATVTLPDGAGFAQWMLDAGHARPYSGVGPKL